MTTVSEKWREEKSLSHVRLFLTLWAVAHQASRSRGFSRHEYWSGLPFPSPGDLSDPGIEPRSPTLQAEALTSEPPGRPHFRERRHQCEWKAFGRRWDVSWNVNLCITHTSFCHEYVNRTYWDLFFRATLTHICSNKLIFRFSNYSFGRKNSFISIINRRELTQERGRVNSKNI